MSCPECKGTGWVTLFTNRSRCSLGCVPPELRNEIPKVRPPEKPPSKPLPETAEAIAQGLAAAINGDDSGNWVTVQAEGDSLTFTGDFTVQAGSFTFTSDGANVIQVEPHQTYGTFILTAGTPTHGTQATSTSESS